MDILNQYEVTSLIKSIKYVDRTQRELERFSNYIYLQSQTKKELKLKDLYELPWDEEIETKQGYTKEEKNDMKSKMEKLRSRIQNGDMELKKWL